MPFFKLKKSRRYNVLSKNAYVACVQLLDGSSMECTLTPESLGKECLESIAQRIELTEIQYLGLRFVNKKDQFQWLELDKPLKKQLDKSAKDHLLYFCVKYFIPEAHKINDEMTRYQYFLQLRSDILDGRVACSHDQAIRLAAYSIQVEFGDHIFEQHTPQFFSDFQLLPKIMAMDQQQLVQLTQEVVNLHQNLQGMPPTVAEIQYIHEAEQLEGCGYEYYNAKDERNNNLIIGTSYNGLFIKPASDQTGSFLKWSDIKALSSSKKAVSIQTNAKDQPVHLIMEDPEMAKYVWRQFDEQRKFTLNIPHEESVEPVLDGSTGAIPDIQQSAQIQRDTSELSEHPSTELQEEQSHDIHGTDTYYVQESGYYQNTDPVGMHYPVGEDVVGSTYSMDQMVISHSPSASYEQRMAALPAYRPSPDYHAVMEQRLTQQQGIAQQSMSQQNMPPPQKLNAHLVLNSNQSQVCSEQEHNKIDSEPLYANLNQFLHMRNSDSGGSSGAGGDNTYENHINYVPSRPVDRSSSLIIHPTYSSPDLHSEHLVTHYNSENTISEVLMNHYKPPPPYPRASSSTPDLASQTTQHNRQLSNSPDLISRKNIGGAVEISQTVYRSVENLSEDFNNLRTAENIGEVDDDLSSEQSDATFHAKDTDEEGELTPNVQDEINPNSVEAEMIRNYLASGIGYGNPVPLYYSSQSVNIDENPGAIQKGQWQENLVDSRDRSLSDTHVSYNGTATTSTPSIASLPQTVVTPAAVQLTASQESVRSVVLMTASQESVKSAVYHSEAGSPVPLKRMQILSTDKVIEHNNSDKLSKDCSPETRAVVSEEVTLTDPGEISTEDSMKLIGNESNKHETINEHPTVLETPNDSMKEEPQEIVKPEETSISSTGEQNSRDQSSPEKSLSEADEVAAVKLRKPGPLRLAAMNGLVISRTSIMMQQNDESRAPKDDRRGLLESKLEEGQVFHEYQQIPRKPQQCKCITALLAENEERNRFQDVLPYEDNRVQLVPHKKRNKTGYINASHVTLSVGPRELWYIATQAPMSNTAADFWQMIWDHNALVIAMVMDLDKKKCPPYWPQKPGLKNKLTFGDFQVVLRFSNSSLCYVTNTLVLIHKPSKQERTIWHLQYTDWPEHGCPEDVYGFLSFLDEIESVQRHAHEGLGDEFKTPIIVHCSAGVGRTGVVILCEIMKNCLEYNQPVNVPEMLTALRNQRMHMVQTVGQYTFVYDSLITYLKNSRLI